MDIAMGISMLLSMASMPAGEVQLDRVQSLNDVGAMVVSCYHPSATFTGVEILEHPWRQGANWKADSSAVLRISYRGNVFRLNHQIILAAMQRGKEFMALPLTDSNKVPQAKDCALKSWTSGE